MAPGIKVEDIDLNKRKALDLALNDIRKNFGDGSIMTLGKQTAKKVLHIPTGSLGLDIALGIGGIPVGRIVEIHGPESSGKTTIALHMIAEAQKRGMTAVFIDAEHALDINYSAKLGVDTEKLIISQPDSGEEALEIVDTLVRSGAINIIVIDSVSALTPKAEIEGEMGDSHMGLQARLMSQALRKLTPLASRNATTIIFINQIRMKIGVVFGNPETTSGGNALKFFASIRIDVRKIGVVKGKDEEIIGNELRLKIIKNKVSPPFKQTTFNIYYDKGINKFGELVDWGVKCDLVDKSGSWYAYNGQKIGQGKLQVEEFFKANPEICDALEEKIRKSMFYVAPVVRDA